MAAKRGVTTVIASGKGGDSILKVVAGQLVGTMFSCEAGASLWEAHERASRWAPLRQMLGAWWSRSSVAAWQGRPESGQASQTSSLSGPMRMWDGVPHALVRLEGCMLTPSPCAHRIWSAVLDLRSCHAA